MSKGSSARSVNGRDQIDDFLDMYDGGFGESDTEDEPSQNRPPTNQSVRSENENQITISGLSGNTLTVPKFSNLIIRDSTDMFRTPESFVDPFDDEARNSNRPNIQYQHEPTLGIARQPSGLGVIGAQYSQFDATRDRYGFKKKSQHVPLDVYEAWDRTYGAYLARRRKKWITVMKDSGLGTENPTRFPPKSAKIKRFVRKGIPPDWRGEAWFWYSGGHQILAKNLGVYDVLVQRAANGDVSPTDEEIIERDLHRTFPDNLMFKPDPVTPAVRLTGPADTPTSATNTETPILKSLRRVLQATSIYNPKIGYCQSLNFLAGLLLLFMEEERAFWMLDIITKTHLPGTHELNLEGANVDLGVLMMCIRESMPAIWTKVGGELDGSSGADERKVPMRLPPITLCCTAWFMSCFIGTLPMETTLRVWDTLFFEGSKTLFRVALAIFKAGEAEIRAINDPMEVFQVVQTIPRRMVNANGVMDICFRRRNGFGHLTQNIIDTRRAERRRGYADERAVAAGERPSSKRSNLFASIRGRK
jgi:TBC1 domain family member 6